MQCSDIAAGAELPAIAIPITLQRLVMEAGANRDLSLMHHDIKVAQATGACLVDVARLFESEGMPQRLFWRPAPQGKKAIPIDFIHLSPEGYGRLALYVAQAPPFASTPPER